MIINWGFVGSLADEIDKCYLSEITLLSKQEYIMKVRKIFAYIIVCLLLGCFLFLTRGLFYRTMTIHELLSENKHLKQAITNLTDEEQIGYAKVISQEKRDGRVFTTVRFVETARGDKLQKILERDYTIEGDIVHLDALIVKFDDKMVMDGNAKSLYLWRRVYGEKTAPGDGLVIEEPGKEPQRYSDLLSILPIKQRELFWSNIWELANDPDRLEQYGIKAIYGNAVYSKLKEELVYIFKISTAGQVYPEVIFDM